MKYIFLSASMPDESAGEYYATADPIAIRDAIIAVASVLIPDYEVVFGGHPTVTKLIADVIRHAPRERKECFTLFQSRWFEGQCPVENDEFVNIEFTEKFPTLAKSLDEMRDKMVKSQDFFAGIFIGGKKGVEEEFNVFQALYPKAKLIPVATSGGAALKIFEEHRKRFDERLADTLAYAALFRDILEKD